MKIAVLTITKDDDHRFEEWCKYYEEYKSEIGLHIIVDDASSDLYINKIRNYFTDSVIIHRSSNGGSNAALNDAIRRALQDKDVDALFNLDNDIKLAPGAITELYNYLYSDNNLGMVGPLVLERDSDIIEDFGVNFNYFKTVLLHHGEHRENIPANTTMYVDVVPGGINMVKRSFYETIGLQDESIFMYCDERDISYRAKVAGIKEGVTSNAIAWHQHKSHTSVGRRLKSSYLLNRNQIYLCRKYRGIMPAILTAIWNFSKASYVYIRGGRESYSKEQYKQILNGINDGLRNKLDNSDLWY